MYNYNYLNNDWYRNTNNSMYQNNENSSLFPPEEAYNKGNLFASLYQQYKNYQPVTLKENNEQEKLFLEFSRMAFAAHELNLYLDNFPNDTSMIQLFVDYQERANSLLKQYEKLYGPITLSGSINTKTPFAWEYGQWPWEGGIK